MHVIYDPRHVLHDPATEVQYGVAMPMYEVPARVESIRAALLTDGSFSFTDPAGHGLEPVLAVHHEGLVRFLGEAWGRWRTHGSWGATLAAWVASNLFDSLACGPSVLGVPEVPAPFAAALESEWLPSRGRITDHVLRLLGQPPAGDDVQPVGGGRGHRPA